MKPTIEKHMYEFCLLTKIDDARYYKNLKKYLHQKQSVILVLFLKWTIHTMKN